MHDLRDARVSVTGAAGFIGSHLVRALVRRGARRIRAIDSLRYGAWANLGEAYEEEAVDTCELDLASADDDLLAAGLEGTEILFHLAAEKHNQSKDDPERVRRVNVDGTARLFEIGRRVGVDKIVFASSLYAYGRRQGPNMVEAEAPQPDTPYGQSKLEGEALLRDLDGVDGTVLRLFFCYGPRQFSGSGYKSVIVSNFERILRGEPPVIRGDGKQALDYVFVDDVVEALMLAATRSGADGPFNVASGRAVSIEELTRRMLAIAGSPLEPSYAPADETAGSRRAGDPTHTLETLGWQAETPLDAGLESVHAWMTSKP